MQRVEEKLDSLNLIYSVDVAINGKFLLVQLILVNRWNMSSPVDYLKN